MMSLWEGILALTALSVNVFLAAEEEGSNLKILQAGKVGIVCCIFFALQMSAMFLGRQITQVPFFSRPLSGDLQVMCFASAAVIFLFLGVLMLYRARKADREEHLRELRYRRILLEALAVAVMTFAVSIACGFLRVEYLPALVRMALVTVAAVIAGLYTGYYQGNRFRRILGRVSGILFLALGIWIFVRITGP